MFEFRVQPDAFFSLPENWIEMDGKMLILGKLWAYAKSTHHYLTALHKHTRGRQWNICCENAKKNRKLFWYFETYPSLCSERMAHSQVSMHRHEYREVHTARLSDECEWVGVPGNGSFIDFYYFLNFRRCGTFDLFTFPSLMHASWNVFREHSSSYCSWLECTFQKIWDRRYGPRCKSLISPSSSNYHVPCGSKYYSHVNTVRLTSCRISKQRHFSWFFVTVFSSHFSSRNERSLGIPPAAGRSFIYPRSQYESSACGSPSLHCALSNGECV